MNNFPLCPECKGKGRIEQKGKLLDALNNFVSVGEGTFVIVCPLCGGVGTITLHDPITSNPDKDEINIQSLGNNFFDHMALSFTRCIDDDFREEYPDQRDVALESMVKQDPDPMIDDLIRYCEGCGREMCLDPCHPGDIITCEACGYRMVVY